MAHDRDSRYMICYYICSESSVRSESVVTSEICKYIKNCFHCSRVTPPLALIPGETKSKPAKKIKKISSLCKRPLESALSKRGEIQAQNQIKFDQSFPIGQNSRRTLPGYVGSRMDHGIDSARPVTLVS